MTDDKEYVYPYGNAQIHESLEDMDRRLRALEGTSRAFHGENGNQPVELLLPEQAETGADVYSADGPTATHADVAALAE